MNGFEIEKYNQYNIPENAKSSTCPLCSEHRKKKLDKCLSVYWDSGLARCNHCGELLQLHTYKKKQSLKNYSKPEWINNTKLSDKVVKWFESRGISQSTLKFAKVCEGKESMPTEWKEKNTIQFPYFRNGELINIKYRTGDKKFKMHKDCELILYNLDAVTLSDSVIIVEGEIDCLSYIESGIYNVVSIPNGSTTGNVNLEYLDNCIEYIENKSKIYLALDNDLPGQNVTKELIRRFGSEKCFLIDFKGCKDANEFLVKYNKETLAFTVKEAKEVPIDGVSSVLDWKDEFDNYLINGMHQGYKTNIESFDRIFSTYTGQYIVVTGMPSSGKSDFVDMMCLGYNNLYGWKTAIASPENKPNTIHAGKIISKVCGEWINKREYLTQAWYKKAISYINDTFKYIDLDGSYDIDRVLEKARSLIFKFGIKVLVIDPYNKIRLKESLNKSINEYTNDYLIKIDEFARKHDILIILVAHPTKPSQENRRSYEPTFYDIKGGGEFYDMSPHGILVHRDYENDLVKIKVLKVKFSHLGENNAHIFLQWNKSNGRYIDFKVQNKDANLVSNPLIDNDNWMIEKDNNLPQSSFDFKNRRTDFEKAFMEGSNDLPF